MQTYFLAKKWLYRAVLLLVMVVVGVGVMELSRLAQDIKKDSPAGRSPQVNGPVTPVRPETVGKQDALLPSTKQDQANKPETPGKSARQDFFVEYRLERDRTRSQRVDMLREIVSSQNSSDETRKEANRELMSLFQTMEKEMELENLIRAEGFKDAIVYLQEKEKTATVTIQTTILTLMDRDKLTTLITRVTGLQKDNIDFICKN